MLFVITFALFFCYTFCTTRLIQHPHTNTHDALQLLADGGPRAPCLMSGYTCNMHKLIRTSCIHHYEP